MVDKPNPHKYLEQMAILHPALKNKEFWYQDVLLICNNLPDLEREDVDLTCQFSTNIKLHTPFVSSPMDTVTEYDMAILIALMGGIGAIHYNNTPDQQANEAEKVKRFEAAFIKNPIVLDPNNKVSDVFNIAQKYGFYSVPITNDGTQNSKLVGMVTHRDVRYLETKAQMQMPLNKVMTPITKLVSAPQEKTLNKNDIRAANKIIRKHNLDTLPIVDKKGHLVALVTDSDIRKNESFPLATKDDNKQLRVLMAVESRINLAKTRIQNAADVGADGIIIDASVVFKEQLEIAKYSKKNFKNLEVIVGNVDSAKMIQAIQKEAGKYVDAIRVGIGPGAACTTQEQLGLGRAQGSAVFESAVQSSKAPKIPIIADGGIRKPSDIVKALALGAKTVMMGGMLAGLEESPGDSELDERAGHLVKKYRGMGSLEAMQEGGSVRYRIDNTKIKVPEGKVKKIGYKGSGYIFLPRLIAAVKQSIQKLGFKDLNLLAKETFIAPNSLN